MMLPPAYSERGVLSMETEQHSSRDMGFQVGSLQRRAFVLPKLAVTPNSPDFAFTENGSFVDNEHRLRLSKDGFTVTPKGTEVGSLKERMLATPNVSIDELEDLGEIGRGGGGRVMKVRDTASGKLFALKIMRLKVDKSTRRRIARELTILHKCNSPYIVNFENAALRDGDVFLCMEYMNAGSLYDIYRAVTRLPSPIIGKIAASVLKGLKYLNDYMSIMHRDIKPANILMDFEGHIKLCDLGVSGLLENHLASSQVGTTAYIAPERIMSTGEYSATADVWSVGITLAEMAIGAYPYHLHENEPTVTIMTNITGCPAPELPGWLDDDLRHFISMCLLKDPDARPMPALLLTHDFVVANDELMKDKDVADWLRYVNGRANVMQGISSRCSEQEMNVPRVPSGPGIATVMGALDQMDHQVHQNRQVHRKPRRHSLAASPSFSFLLDDATFHMETLGSSPGSEAMDGTGLGQSMLSFHHTPPNPSPFAQSTPPNSFAGPLAAQGGGKSSFFGQTPQAFMPMGGHGLGLQASGRAVPARTSSSPDPNVSFSASSPDMEGVFVRPAPPGDGGGVPSPFSSSFSQMGAVPHRQERPFHRRTQASSGRRQRTRSWSIDPLIDSTLSESPQQRRYRR